MALARRELEQRIVDLHDRRPVDATGAAAVGVHRLRGRFELVAADHARRADAAQHLRFLVGRAGLEPTTNGLKDRDLGHF